MIILGLSKVDRNAQNPLELVSYLSLLVPLQATKSRDDLINSRFLFNRSKGAFNRSKGILDQSKLVKLKFFQIFLVIGFDVSLEQNIVSWSHHNEIEIKTEFHWCYSLKVQSNIHNIKLKQHHNINISFYQTIIWITM